LRERVRKGFSPEEKRFYLRVAAGVLGTFLLGYLLTMLLFFPGWGDGGIVTVPDLRGKTLAQAKRLASRADLELEEGSTLAHARVPAGAVLAQTPLPGQETTRGSAVRVIVSSGPDRRPVPAVEQLTGAQAEALLRNTGFAVRVARVHDERPVGRVLGVKPAAGTPVPAGAPVELVLSAGPPMVAVPPVVGLTGSAARDTLRAVGLRLGRVEYDPGSGAPEGEVLAQDPAAGASLRSGGAVGVVVAGSPPVAPEPVEAPPAPDTTAVAPPPPPT
jgi:beta-lactam-binding protein with PASTA domain